MFDEIKSYPIYQAIQRRSIAPFWEQFNAQNRAQTLKNFTTRGLPSLAAGMTMKGGMSLPKPRIAQPNNQYYNLSPNIQTMLKGYSRSSKLENPKFYYKNGGGVFNNTIPQNQRALASSYLSKFNIKNWGEKPKY